MATNNGNSKSLTVERDGDVLVIRLPIASKPAPSASGKTLVIGSTHGNMATSVLIDGQPVIVGVNAYIRK